MCFLCDKYRHQELKRPLKTTKPNNKDTNTTKKEPDIGNTMERESKMEEPVPGFGPWMCAQEAADDQQSSRGAI